MPRRDRLIEPPLRHWLAERATPQPLSACGHRRTFRAESTRAIVYDVFRASLLISINGAGALSRDHCGWSRSGPDPAFRIGFAKGGEDVSGPHSWTRRPGRRIRRRVALRGRVRRRPFRAGLPELRLRAHGRAGDGVLPHRRQGNPAARAGDAARRADHPGPDAAAPGRPVQGPAQRTGTSSSTRRATSPTSGSATSCAASSASRLCTVPATEIAIKHVGRPVPNVPLLAGFAAISGEIKLESVVARRSARSSPARSPRRTSPRPRKPTRSRSRRRRPLHA